MEDPDFELWVGDCLEVLADMPAESVDCCVTSPPYWNLRDYGVAGQIGLESTPETYVSRLVDVFHEVRKVLTPHGTCWINLGDSHHEKQLQGIPWLVARALQAAGWYIRSEIIWAKPNPLPESMKDRPTKAHEHVFLLTKGPRYYFDQESVREPFESRAQQRLTPTSAQPLAAARIAAGVQQGDVQGGTHTNRFAVQVETLAGECGCHDGGCGRTFHADDCGCSCHEGEKRGPDGRRKTAHDHSTDKGHANYAQIGDGRERWPHDGRNIRSVWEIPTQPYPEAHFATYPEELVRRCLLAGCPKGGTVLDPFLGSGTTALVARKMGRRCVGIELNVQYARLAASRLQQLSLLAGEAA